MGDVEDRVTCLVCGREFRCVTHFHLRLHGMTTFEYLIYYPGSKLTSEKTRRSLGQPAGWHHGEEVVEKIKKSWTPERRKQQSERSKSDKHKGALKTFWESSRGQERRQELREENTGKPFPETAKEKLRKRHKGKVLGNHTPESHKKQGRSLSKLLMTTERGLELRKMHSTRDRTNNSRSMKAFYRTPKGKLEKEKKSKRMVEWRSDPDSPLSQQSYSHKGYFFSPKNEKLLFYRSSLELDLFGRLELDGEIVSYLVEPFYIEYEFEGQTHRYLPDVLIFFSDGRTELWEVKPESLTKDLCTQSKFLAAITYCRENNISKFVVWTGRNQEGETLKEVI